MKNFILILFLLFPFSSFAQVTLTEFQIISSVFHEEFDDELSAQNATLYINRDPSPDLKNYWWNFDHVHASYTSYSDDSGTDHNLYLFGGYARMKGMTMDGVALTLCHELGHGIGGMPLKKKSPRDYPASTEGQSDYFATRYCLKRIFKSLPESFPVEAPSDYTKNLCQQHFFTDSDLYLCYRSFQTLEVDRIFLRTQTGDGSDVYFETPDKTIVTQVDLSPTFYPSAQCRLDTMVAGILELERPRCWWAP